VEACYDTYYTENVDDGDSETYYRSPEEIQNDLDKRMAEMVTPPTCITCKWLRNGVACRQPLITGLEGLSIMALDHKYGNLDRYSTLHKKRMSLCGNERALWQEGNLLRKLINWIKY
jgi:hypothetical protein